MIIKGFNSAGITEAVNNAQSVYEKLGNPFQIPLALISNKEKERVVY